MFVMTVYSTTMCPPCAALKDWLRSEGIEFTDIPTKTLDEAGRKWLREKILAVSRINHPTVPAVRLTVDGTEHWVSNHGESDVTEMIAELKKLLKR